MDAPPVYRDEIALRIDLVPRLFYGHVIDPDPARLGEQIGLPSRRRARCLEELVQPHQSYLIPSLPLSPSLRGRLDWRPAASYSDGGF